MWNEIKAKYGNLNTEIEPPLLKQEQPSETIHPRAESTYLNIIAAMLETLLDTQVFKSQNELIGHLAKRYKGYDGLGESTLKQKFSMARKNLDVDQSN